MSLIKVKGSSITGTLEADRIPELPTSKITSGTFADARLSSSSITQHVDLTSLSASNLTSGTIPNARYGTPTFNGSNLTSLPSSFASSIGAIGTYALCRRMSMNHGSTQPGNTVSGSDLQYTNSQNDTRDNPSISGTWRCMGFTRDTYSNNDYNAVTVWLRIS